MKFEVLSSRALLDSARPRIRRIRSAARITHARCQFVRGRASAGAGFYLPATNSSAGFVAVSAPSGQEAKDRETWVIAPPEKDRQAATFRLYSRAAMVTSEASALEISCAYAISKARS